MRQDLEDGRTILGLEPAFKVADEFGLKVGRGQKMGDGEANITLTTPGGESFVFTANRHNFRSSGKALRRELVRRGFAPPTP